MTPDQIASLISQVGVGGVTAYALYKVLSNVGERLIAAVDKLGDKLDQHTKDDVAAQGEVREALVRLEKTIEAELPYRERAPVETSDVGRYRGRRKDGA